MRHWPGIGLSKVVVHTYLWRKWARILEQQRRPDPATGAFPILSSADGPDPRIAGTKPQVVVLKCTSMRPGQERLPKHNETVLDDADGLDWKTLCRCDLLFTVEKSSLTNKRGEVTHARRREIARKIIQGLAIAGL